MKKSGLIIIGAIILAVVIAGGSFYGGMAYQRTQAANAQRAFFASRGITGNFSGNGGNFTGGNFGGGFNRGINGQVASINGNTLQISTGNNTITVTLSGSTAVLKTNPGASSDLAKGDQVNITGQRDSSGSMTATQIIIEKAAQ